uniref:Viral enhancing factor-2 n=1 Tax=Lymantria dispar multicapsid nuclear polyhedrosis virus TaxID=10449 RepID=A0A1B1MQS7_NPVLD|nr:viral enhancing factor -2 [Lymantria dispar multiple nucleopolyhedrovirus]
MTTISLNFVVESVQLPPWLAVTDVLYGLQHARVALGVVCDENSVMRVRLANGHEIESVVLRCLNSDRRTESAITIRASDGEQTVTHGQTFVPFVDRPKGGPAAWLDITIVNYTHRLPMYVHGETVQWFFKQQWANSDAPYALIDLGPIAIFTAAVDRQLVISTDLVQVCDFYERLISLYDTLINIKSVDNQNDDDDYYSSVDRGYKKQFFCKPDLGGPGYGFYGVFYLGDTNESIARYLRISIDNWLILHEVGHAYDFDFTQMVPNLNEVWNNILCDRLQHSIMTPEERQQKSWVYDEGRRAEIERQIVTLIKTDSSYNDDWNFRQKLTVFTWMMNTPFGPESMQAINSSWRLNKTFPQNLNAFVMDWWCLNSHHDDFVPYLSLMRVDFMSVYFERPNFLVRPLYTFERTLAAMKRIPYPVCMIVEDFDVIDNNYGLSWFESNFDLIYPGEAALPPRTITIDLIIDDVSQVAGAEFSVFDGNELVHRSLVSAGGRVVVAALHVGVYTLVAPRGRDKRYDVRVNTVWQRDCPNLYLIVSSGTSRVSLVYQRLEVSTIETLCRGYLFGLSDRLAATFNVNIAQKTINITVYRRDIHQIFPNNYFGVQLLNNDRSLHNEIIVPGTNATLGSTTIEYEPGQLLRLMFSDAGLLRRLQFMDKPIGNWAMTEYSLNEQSVVPSDTTDAQALLELQQRMLNNLSQSADFLDLHPNLLNMENQLRDQMYLMIQSLPDPQILMDTYCRYLPNYYQCLSPTDAAHDDTENSMWWALAVLTIFLIVLCFFLVFYKYFVVKKIYNTTPTTVND